MTCPCCAEKALAFAQFLYYDPSETCCCRSCGATLRAAVLTRYLYLATLALALVSFAVTFPLMSDFIDSQADKAVRTLLGLFLPCLVIPGQVILFFMPAVAYTWKWGRLRPVAASGPGQMDARMGSAG
jgi:hypothetical protein